MTINDVLQSLVAVPLAEPLTLAAVWHDICHLTGVEPGCARRPSGTRGAALAG